MGWCLKICEGLLLENGHLSAISSITLSIFKLV